MRTLLKSYFVCLLILSAYCLPARAEGFVCPGDYTNHLQGFTADDNDKTKVYWSFTTVLVKTDNKGTILSKRDVPWHHGDCCVHDGKLYVCVVERPNNDAAVYIYNCSDLSFVERIPLEGQKGTDGIAYCDGYFYISPGYGEKITVQSNKIVKMTLDLKKVVQTWNVPGETIWAFQSMSYANGSFWMGTYGKAKTIQTDRQFHVIAHHDQPFCYGSYALPNSEKGETRLMVASSKKDTATKKTIWYAFSVVLRDGKLIRE